MQYIIYFIIYWNYVVKICPILDTILLEALSPDLDNYAILHVIIDQSHFTILTPADRKVAR